VHGAEVHHLPAEFVGRDLADRREDRRHRVVDPDVDGPEIALDALGRALHPLGVRHVRGNRQAPDLGGGRFEALKSRSATFAPWAATGHDHHHGYSLRGARLS
jgi:hypothetical protein